MEPNHNDVTTPLSVAEETLDLLSHAEHLEDVIDALRGPERTLNARLADAHNELGATFKRADILASLAIAEAIDRLADASSTPASGVREIYLGEVIQ